MYGMIRRLLRDREGSLFVVVALSAMAVVGSVGVAVDMGRSQMVQAKLQNAVDAAGLAAGSTLNTGDLTAVATKYVNVNFKKGNLGATLHSVGATLSQDKKIVTITASAELPTTVMKVFGRESVEVDATTEITRSNKGLELALVLDTTGSMQGTKLTALKDAAHDLVDILFGDDSTGENLWIGVVPFSQSVNIGSSRTNWLNAAHFNSLIWNTPNNWSGCVEARWSSNRDVTDDPPFDLADPSAATPAAPYERLKAYYAPMSTWTIGYGTNTTRICSGSSCSCSNNGPCNQLVQTAWNKGYTITCGGSGSSKYCDKKTRTYALDSSNSSYSGSNVNCPAPVTPLTNVKTTVEAGIDALVARGFTHVNYGAVWGWRMISPRWRGYWGGTMDTNSLPLNYNAPLMSKAVVIMTDGANTTTSYSAYPPASNVDEADMDTKLTTVCNAMKAQGVVVYTILFQEDDAGIKTLMKGCATTPDHFFDSPTAESLQSAFQTIGDSLANLRISK